MRFSVESPFRKPAKTSENSKQMFPLFSFLATMTLGRIHVFCPHGRIESSLGGRLYNSLKGRHQLKRTESHGCEVNTLGIPLELGRPVILLSTFLRFLKGIYVRKSLTESERSGRFQPC